MKRKAKRFCYVNLIVGVLYSGRGAKKIKKIVHEFDDSYFNKIWPKSYAIKTTDSVHIR